MNPHEILFHYFKEMYPANKDGLSNFINAFNVVTLKKNSILLSPHCKDNKLRFLTSGIIREYYANDNKEININFYTKPSFITDFSSFDHDQVVNKWQQALTDIEILVLDKSDFNELLIKYPCGKSFLDKIFRDLIDYRELLDFNRLTKSPEDLYQCILNNNKEWLNKIPQYHIASFMGISPETLSRIRHRIS